ncbi:MAG TPA: hypothetical protein VFR87_19140 [Nocardioidaceae bacterium]|nr:hypothetical protein [Nocardioidaceae bacterium]
MPRITAVGGVAAAALVVALGVAAPAAAVPWPPPLHGGDSPSAEPSVAADHADHVTGMDHGDHGEHEAGSAAPEDHGDHGAESAVPEDHGDHGEHEAESAAPEDHSRHGSPAEEDPGHDTGHDTGHDSGHGGEPDTVSDQTRVSVLGGFGALNAAVVGSAFLLRRRDRRTGTKPRTDRGSHR